MNAAAPLLIAILAGCTGHKAILEAYEADRDAASAHSTATPDTPPDLVVHLSPPLARELVDLGVASHGHWKEDVKAPGVVLTPDLALDRVDLVDRGRADCPSCLVADVALSGRLRYSSPLGKDEVPVSGKARVVVELEVPARGDGFVVKARLAEVRKPVVDVAGLPKQLGELASGPLASWLDGRLSQLEPFVLASFPGDDLPVAAMRVAADGGGGVRVEIVTDAPQRGRVDPALAGPSDGLRVDASATSLVWLGRREAFAQGPVSQDPEVAVAPTTLEVHDGRFNLGFRLWKLSGGSWWWDLVAAGNAAFRGRKLALEAKDVQEVGHSQGAGLADPLAMLAQGRVLDEIAKVLTRSVPTPGPAEVDGQAIRPVLRALDGSGDLVQLTGDLSVREVTSAP